MHLRVEFASASEQMLKWISEPAALSMKITSVREQHERAAPFRRQHRAVKRSCAILAGWHFEFTITQQYILALAVFLGVYHALPQSK
jgi:hypothetical protein